MLVTPTVGAEFLNSWSRNANEFEIRPRSSFRTNPGTAAWTEIGWISRAGLTWELFLTSIQVLSKMIPSPSKLHFKAQVPQRGGD